MQRNFYILRYVSTLKQLKKKVRQRKIYIIYYIKLYIYCKTMIDIIEHNAILYYADYLRLKEESKTVTDNCKYYFIYGSPINSAYLVDLQPFYDENDKYYIQAY